MESKGFKRISLSDPIKDKFRELNPGKEPTKDSFGEDWRAELQDIGNKGRQGEYIESSVESNGSNYYDYWVDLALKSVNGSDCDIVIDGIQKPKNRADTTLSRIFSPAVIWNYARLFMLKNGRYVA